MTKKDIIIRTDGHAGRITLNRPEALNALTSEMSIAIEDALDRWRDDPDIALLVIDAAGTKAFCAGGDIAELYEKGSAGDFAFGRAFWHQEYQMNLKIAQFPKPVVVFMQGFVMGGGVGVACHASHRIVSETTKVAMPECGIGLVPDVGGTFILGRAAGEVGTYLGLTGTRMGPFDAIFAGFADYFVSQDDWVDLIDDLAKTGSIAKITKMAQPVQKGDLESQQSEIDALFGGATLSEIGVNLAESHSQFAEETSKRLAKGSPLAMACGLELIRAARSGDLSDALEREYRFSYRAQKQGDFLEGIRAQIIDRDFAPKWHHSGFDVPRADIDQMIESLGANDWTETGEPT
ncbi:enoyl-CoA hydratase/isomerase family protein [Yoonia sp. I 8.24]|uniref:enoyl-CoA hydratase/isomerase family protein n=1 Tax=Yoonia sp. I 8.24 TaxID=1537229 RepID=UPI001EE11D23|nr:enoyl-CoA hydratase/isomerase family protein [Yoonia sp. I 8.24]MCG3267106.1 enoyl-CoA hydratase/isomerase family protein [Yoonia sp. I 8.24]